MTTNNDDLIGVAESLGTREVSMEIDIEVDWLIQRGPGALSLRILNELDRKFGVRYDPADFEISHQEKITFKVTADLHRFLIEGKVDKEGVDCG